jgi:hypothetical protein
MKMGLNKDGISFLLDAHKRGVDFSTTVTLGRQGMHLTLEELRGRLGAYDYMHINAGSLIIDGYPSATRSYCESFLKMMGAQSVESFDCSVDEGADHVHDFNAPLPEEFNERYSAVIDSGSLEHIFNFPQAIANCMRMVKVGGHFLANTPCNCTSGHGFYQFAPDLFYRVLCPANGFTDCRVVLSDGFTGEQWEEMPDPAVVHRRVGPSMRYVNGAEVEPPTHRQSYAYLLVLARKIFHVELQPRSGWSVQQSGY